MTPDTQDTIVAIATARGAGQRGVVRLSGPGAIAVVSQLRGPIQATVPTRLADCSLTLVLGSTERHLPADLFVWPDTRSYTHQPAVEIHTIGSPPVLDAVVRACVTAGARLAEPGEFTLRAFLAGRLDLTQAEAVLGVIDASNAERLDDALQQLAGGLSTPLHRLRADLLGLLADLEAGLDFVEEEDVSFVEASDLSQRLREAAELVGATEQQMTGRDTADRLPRVAIVGPPNVGKSRLFNSLVARHGVEPSPAESLVADQVGVTRDALVAVVEHAGRRFSLIDTAGDDAGTAIDVIDSAARERLEAVRRDVDLLLVCQPASSPMPLEEATDTSLAVATMSDRFDGRLPDPWLATSAAEGHGLATLITAVTDRLGRGTDASAVMSSTAERCTASLAGARAALTRAAEAATCNAGDELVSFELREALDALGQVVGEVITDEVLGEIFGKFCIGK